MQPLQQNHQAQWGRKRGRRGRAGLGQGRSTGRFGLGSAMMQKRGSVQFGEGFCLGAAMEIWLGRHVLCPRVHEDV